jgi:hypothetical protein
MTASAATAVATALRVEGGRKSFETGPPWHRHGLDIVRGASIHVEAEELVGLVGENGSGKSMLIKISSAFSRATWALSSDRRASAAALRCLSCGRSSPSASTFGASPKRTVSTTLRRPELREQLLTEMSFAK